MIAMKLNTSSSIMQFLLVFGLLLTYLPITQADYRVNLTEFVYPAIGEPGWFLPLLNITKVEFSARERTQLPKTDQLLVPNGKSLR
jgi:hypothetical protein